MNGCLFGNKCNNCYHVGFEASLILQLQDFSMKKKMKKQLGNCWKVIKSGEYVHLLGSEYRKNCMLKTGPLKFLGDKVRWHQKSPQKFRTK